MKKRELPFTFGKVLRLFFHFSPNNKKQKKLFFQITLFLFPIWKLSLIFRKNSIKKSNLYTDEEKKKISNIKNSAEFHDLVSAKNMGLKNSDEYYELTKLYGKPSKVKVPTLIITSEDDPLTSREFIDVKELTDKNNNNLAFILTKEGGHVSFCQGFNGMGSYVEEIAEEFFNILKK